MGNIAKDDLDLPTDESRWDELKEEFSALTTWLKVTLADRIEKAEISQSLVTSPVTLAASSWGVSPAMRRIIKSQASAGENQQEYLLHAKPIMQINPFHPLIRLWHRRARLLCLPRPQPALRLSRRRPRSHRRLRRPHSPLLRRKRLRLMMRTLMM